MDRETLAAYDAAAEAFAKDWHEQPAPSDLYALVKRYFRRGLTADIGCGAGREVAWLRANGYLAIGYDASHGMLQAARSLYPSLAFEPATLPTLAGITDGKYDNVLCETVIMHLTRPAIAPAVRRLMSILKPDGILYLSWRVTEGPDQRDKHGRLYSAFEENLVFAELATATVLFSEEIISVSSGKTVHRVVVRKPGITI